MCQIPDVAFWVLHCSMLVDCGLCVIIYVVLVFYALK